MKDKHPQDTDIRAALNQRYAHEPQLPDGFTERVLEKANDECRMKNEESACAIGSQSNNPSSFILHPSFTRKVAIFIGILIMGGIAIAAIYMAAPRNEATHRPAVPSVVALPQHVDPTPSETILFNGQTLDSIVNMVANHYHLHVQFNDEAIRTLRIHTKWDTTQPFGVFMESLNELDGLLIETRQDTIFITRTTKEDE